MIIFPNAGSLCLGAGLALSALSTPLAAAESSYWRLTNDHISVMTSTSSKHCTQLANQFLIYERTLKDLANIDADVKFPAVAVYALSERDANRVFLTERDKQEQRSKQLRIYSKYISGLDLNLAAIVNAEGSADEALQSVLLLYGQSMLQSGNWSRYPPWFQVGVANITNGLLIRNDGSILLNRNVTFEPDVEKGQSTKVKYPLDKLLSVRPSELSAGGDIKEFSKRAREWAFFGLLTTPDRKAKFHELAVLMRQGTPAEDAVKDAFGISLQELVAEYEAGKWRKELNYRIPAAPLAVQFDTPAKVEESQTDALLSVVAERVQQQAERRRD